ncbi:MAG: hypothetical protein AAB432_01215 [Patescibacteria group bacterium]
MIIYLYGPDGYRRQQKLKEIIEVYKEKHKTLDFFVADLEENEEDWSKIRDFLNQPSMFVDSKLAVVRESGLIEEKDWIRTIKSQLNTPKTFLVISDNAAPKKNFKFLLEESVTHQAFPELIGQPLHLFLTQAAAAINLEFNPDALRFLISYLEKNGEAAPRAINELEKIFLARFGSPISLSNLEKLIRSSESPVVFSSARAMLFSGEAKKRLTILEELFLVKEESAYIFNSLAYQAKGREIFRLADYDVSVKSGELGYEEVLTSLALVNS